MAVFQRAELLIPREEYLAKWPVIACDQFTSQPEYWKKTAESVENVPSAYHIIFPEAELGGDEEARIDGINRSMRRYLDEGIFRSFPDSYVYVERTLRNGLVRRGLVGVLDLESYDYHDDADTAARATEKTVVSRIPPRVRIRGGAPIESSHVLLLCSDPADRLLGTVAKDEALYDLELPQGGGRLRGWLVRGRAADRFDAALANYLDRAPDGFAFAVGDGNHSLAAAKACWEQIKARDQKLAGSEHPARYAMVELENLFDPSQQFEAIHRIVHVDDPRTLIRELEALDRGCGQTLFWHTKEGSGSVRLGEDALPVAVLQSFLDAYLAREGGTIDYIHGSEVAVSLAQEKGAAAFILPAIEKDELFTAILRSGVLPRKTFSMGSAVEKRYYLECRKIV